MSCALAGGLLPRGREVDAAPWHGQTRSDTDSQPAWLGPSGPAVLTGHDMTLPPHWGDGPLPPSHRVLPAASCAAKAASAWGRGDREQPRRVPRAAPSSMTTQHAEHGWCPSAPQPQHQTLLTPRMGCMFMPVIGQLSSCFQCENKPK